MGHNLLMRFSSLYNSEMAIFETHIFYNLTMHNDQISYVKHVLDPIHVLLTLFGCFFSGGGVPRGMGHNPLMRFSSLYNSEMAIFETDIFFTI